MKPVYPEQREFYALGLAAGRKEQQDRIRELEQRLERIRRVTANLRNSAENTHPELKGDYDLGTLHAVEAVEGALTPPPEQGYLECGYTGPDVGFMDRPLAGEQPATPPEQAPKAERCAHGHTNPPDCAYCLAFGEQPAPGAKCAGDEP
jgi:hypothetical protein